MVACITQVFRHCLHYCFRCFQPSGSAKRLRVSQLLGSQSRLVEAQRFSRFAQTIRNPTVKHGRENALRHNPPGWCVSPGARFLGLFWNYNVQERSCMERSQLLNMKQEKIDRLKNN